MKEIPISQIPGIRIGQTEDIEKATGCTVLICNAGAPAGLYISGGGPAGRETSLLDPLTADHNIHAIVLSGGSAFGLGAADGVVKYLEEHGIGYDTRIRKVPLVCQSDIFDLGLGDPYAFPDAAMGYRACVASEASGGGNFRHGNYGVGCGASIGKCLGKDFAMKSGIGSFAVQVGDLIVGAMVVVNAFGDIYEAGKQIAGMRTSKESHDLRSAEDELIRMLENASAEQPFKESTGGWNADGSIENTTLGIVITNAKLHKTELVRLARMADDGLARAIRPVHTTFDGDSVYTMSVGDVVADFNTVGTLAAMAVEKAILSAVKETPGAYDLPGLADGEFFQV